MPKLDSSGGGCAPATPLAKKLGLLPVKTRPLVVALMGEPEGFQGLLNELPETVRFAPRLGADTGLAIWFARTLPEVDAAIETLALRMPVGVSAWIVYPKKHLRSGFNENNVRNAGLARGLVDYKICSVDDSWSGMKFARRKVTTA